MTDLHQVAKSLRIGTEWVLAVRWYNKQERGRATSVDDGRCVITKKQEDRLNEFIKGEHEAGRQVFRRTVIDYLECSYGLEMSNRAVGGLLQCLVLKRRTGGIKIPPLNEERKNRIRLFLVEMNLAKRVEDAGVAVIVSIDESFVHHAHGSAYSCYFPSDDKGVVQDGIGRTTGKGLRIFMVDAITVHRPSAELKEGFPIREGWFKAKENRAKKMKPAEADFETSDEQTAELLWQAKLATGNHHNAMMDGMFMQWLKHRLTLAFDAQFKNNKMFLVLDSASYHHYFDEELKVPKTNSKKYNVELLRKYGCRSFKVTRESKGKAAEDNFEVPVQGLLSNANRKNSVSKVEIASVTRTYFRKNFPQQLEEKAETYMREKGLGGGAGGVLIVVHAVVMRPLTSHPCKAGTEHAGFSLDQALTSPSAKRREGRDMLDISKQIRLGWYGEPEWDGQEGGWKAANCGKLEHAIYKMNKWIGLYGGNLSGTIDGLEYSVADYQEAMAEDEIEDGVEEQTDEWLGEDAEDAI
ncbi:unnamed protein product [Ectocarpus sp. CCAP 1310/34]|nr:unnamed protein product [Ectocarpus sp. CCAP 1310/34]